MEKELIYLLKKFSVRKSIQYNEEICICTSAEFSRKDFMTLCATLGETFFDYIEQVIVYHELDSAAVTLSQHALKKIRIQKNF